MWFSSLQPASVLFRVTILPCSLDCFPSSAHDKGRSAMVDGLCSSQFPPLCFTAAETKLHFLLGRLIVWYHRMSTTVPRPFYHCDIAKWTIPLHSYLFVYRIHTRSKHNITQTLVQPHTIVLLQSTNSSEAFVPSIAISSWALSALL